MVCWRLPRCCRTPFFFGILLVFVVHYVLTSIRGLHIEAQAAELSRNVDRIMWVPIPVRGGPKAAPAAGTRAGTVGSTARPDTPAANKAELKKTAAAALTEAPGGKIPLDVAKLSWLHVPKVATSFINVLMTWACPGMANEAIITRILYDDMFLNGATRIPEDWRCPKELRRPLRCTHKAVVTKKSPCNYVNDSDGHFVGVFRQPEQRILSGFIHGRHGDGNMNLDEVEYAKRVAGCQTKMLLGHRCYNRITVTAKSGQMAVERLEKSFAFVGILEEWALTVCLFHAMFGGQCHRREFTNNRPSMERMAGQLSGGYDAKTRLRGWKDETDGMVYDYAKKRFRADLHKFGVTWDKCRESICAGHPEAFPRGGDARPAEMLK